MLGLITYLLLLCGLFFTLPLTQATRLDGMIPASTTAGTVPYETNNPTADERAIPVSSSGLITYYTWTPEEVQRQMQVLRELELGTRGQYIIAFCPEHWGQEPKSCDSCGGDTREPGLCGNIMLTGDQENCPVWGHCGVYCQCNPGEGPDTNPDQVTSITTISGMGGTVIWEPMTISQYSNLRASTTVTFSDLAQTTTGDSSLETFVAVIVAGGIAWWAAAQSGGAAAIAAINPPTELPKNGRKDDSKCQKNPKDNCSNCGGSDDLGLCSSGTTAGCPCDDNQQCPDNPPKCTDTNCGGDNGNSQCSASGSIKGCTCCPNSALSCSDASECKGDDGSHCQAAKYKGCGCLWLTEVDAPSYQLEPPAPIPESAESSYASMVFTTAWSANYKNVPGYEIPSRSCAVSDYTPTTSLNTGSTSFTFLPATNCYCRCGATQTMLLWGTNSAHSLTSWSGQDFSPVNHESYYYHYHCSVSYINHSFHFYRHWINM